MINAIRLTYALFMYNCFYTKEYKSKDVLISNEYKIVYIHSFMRMVHPPNTFHFVNLMMHILGKTHFHEIKFPSLQ